MSHSITGKLNKAANQHQGNNGMTFFISIGEKNYDFKTKSNVWTNYDVALFAKDAQIQFYADNLVEGAIVSVSGTGLILDVSNAQYPKLSLQDAKLGFVSGGQPAQAQQQSYQQPQNQAPQQQAPTFQPHQAGGFLNQPQQHQQQPIPNTFESEAKRGEYAHKRNIQNMGRYWL